MKGLSIAALVLVAVLSQEAVAPLFPFRTASADFGVVLIGLVALVAGGRRAMLVTPFFAICLAFTSGLPPGLVLMGYVPVVPLMGWIAEQQFASSPPVRLSLVVVATGAWVRVLLTLAAVTGGAEVSPVATLGSLLLPGAVLDLAVALPAYAGCRLAGWDPGRPSRFRKAY